MDESRAAFDAAVKRSGLTFSTEEVESVAKLAGWMRQGLAGIAATGTATPISDADAALDFTIFEQGKMLRDGRLTSAALVEASLRRIEARDVTYRTFYVVDREGARAAASAADRAFAEGQDLGPLHGIPVGIKDMIDVAGFATTANAPGRRDKIADADAVVIERLRQAGAIIIGKLATYEWGTVGPDNRGAFPYARNPWDIERITGGSSSGSAAAVAGGLLRTTLGSDTGGSLRGPSFYCGVVGLKPTFALVPRDGALPMSASMDHLGPISATVAEAAVTLDIIAATPRERSASRFVGQPISGLRIGYARNWFAPDSQTAPAVLTAVDAAVSTLSQLGALVGEIELPDYYDIEVASAAILHREGFDFHAEALRNQPEAYGRRAFLSIAAGLAVTDDELAKARQTGAAFRWQVDAVLAEQDAIVTVGALTTALLAAPFEKEAVWTPMRTIGFNVSGHPVLAMPVGFHEGLPIGIQIIGRHHDDAGIIRIGHALEQALDVSLQRPPQLK